MDKKQILASQQRKQQSNSRRRKRQKNKRPWLIISLLLGAVIIVLGVFLVLANQQNQNKQVGANDAISAVTSLKSDLYTEVGAGSATNPMHAIKNVPILKGERNKPELIYIGAEYCPYCASQRWSVIAALSRFGKFSNLQPITSGEGSIPTFSFHDSTYSSPYLELVAKETGDNQPYPNTQKLDDLTSDEQQIFDTYDKQPYAEGSGGIPFIDIANQQVSSGIYFSPSMLTVLGSLSYNDIVTQLKDPGSDVAQAIIGGANYLTAAICVSTNNQPSNVCTDSSIMRLQRRLPTSYIHNHNKVPLALALGITRERKEESNGLNAYNSER
jgi:thiol-disulfide isomerase/thioredoxin